MILTLAEIVVFNQYRITIKIDTRPALGMVLN